MSQENIQQRFFNDPMWEEVETLILGYVEPLIDMNTIDTSQPAEHVKAEIIGRTLAYNGMVEFFNQTGIVKKELKVIKNPYA